jgi:hypothetical protein
MAKDMRRTLRARLDRGAGVTLADAVTIADVHVSLQWPRRVHIMAPRYCKSLSLVDQCYGGPHHHLVRRSLPGLVVADQEAIASNCHSRMTSLMNRRSNCRGAIGQDQLNWVGPTLLSQRVAVEFTHLNLGTGAGS